MQRLFKIWRITLIFSILAASVIVIGIISYNYLRNNNANAANSEITDNKTKNNPGEKSAKLSQNGIIDSNIQVKSKQTVSPECLPSNFKFISEVLTGNKIVENFNRGYNLSFPTPEKYSLIEGIPCFRGNNYRNSASYGYADINEEKLVKVWFAKTGYIDTWTGVGWNGQPAIIKWADNVKGIMNIYPYKKKAQDLKEVIYATLDGKIYFLDLSDGKPTRQVINIGYPHKGSVSVDSRGYPLLYAGQGIDEVAGKKVPIGYRIFSLINQKMLYFIDGYDKYALRDWGAFDSTSILDAKTDTLIECGENGIFYTMKLNTKFDPGKKNISIKPEIDRYRYHSTEDHKLGTENSVAIYKNYAYFADNGGLLQCVNLDTLKPVWVRDVTDDTDSTPVIEEKGESEVYLYTACEVDKQGTNGSSYVRKIDALTGELVWQKSYNCFFDGQVNGGALATPVVGKNDIENLVIFNIARTGKMNGGKLVALDKKTGNEIWVVNLDNYSWSSPVDVYTKNGKSYLIVCDSGGYMNLYEGISGKMLDRIQLESNIEGSPAVYENMIVVGTRGQKIWGIKLK